MKKRIDRGFLYFVTFIYSISTGEVSAVDIFKVIKNLGASPLKPHELNNNGVLGATAPNGGFAPYFKMMEQIYNIGIEWKYGLANALETISNNLKKDIITSQFMMKLSQILRLGESLSTFLRHEFYTTLKLYTLEYEKTLEFTKTLLSIYTALSSTAIFIISASMLMAILSGQNATLVLILVTSSLLSGLGVFAYLLYKILPRDELVNEIGAIGGTRSLAPRRLFLTFMPLGILGVLILGVLGAMTLIPIGGNSYYLHYLIFGVLGALPLMFLGYYAKRIENKVLSMNKWYPTFIRQFGEIYSTVGSVRVALRSTLKNNFGPLSTLLNSLLNRIENRVSIEEAFNLFSLESGSTIITNNNTITTISIIKGSKMDIVGNILSEITITLNELYNKRLQVTNIFESTLLILHILSLTVLTFMTDLTIIFNTMLNQYANSNIIKFGSIDPNTISITLPLMVIAISILNGVVMKIARGGYYKTMWFNIGLLILIGSLTVYVADIFIKQLMNLIPLGAITPNTP